MTAWCATCGGNQTIDVCPPSCNGSHVADYPMNCPDCRGAGTYPADDQCRHCGHYIDLRGWVWVDKDRQSVCGNTGGPHQPMSPAVVDLTEPASSLVDPKGQEPA